MSIPFGVCTKIKVKEKVCEGLKATHIFDGLTICRQYRNKPGYNVLVLRKLFASSKVALIYGSAGTGKSTMVKHISNFFSNRKKIYLTNLFYHCAECDMPVTIHIAPKISGYYGIVDDLGLPRLEKMLKKHKNLKILGHSQLFWAEISADLTEKERDGYPTGKVKEPGRITQLMREYENLYCDVSANSGMNALMRDPDHAHKFIEEFSDRLLYGCDYTATFNTHTYEMNDFLSEITDNGIMSDENFYKFVRGNAVKLLDIKN